MAPGALAGRGRAVPKRPAQRLTAKSHVLVCSPVDSSSTSTPLPPRARLAMDTATILHADLDAFYASVEQMLDPSLKGKPIAVGGGVVLAASYEAKAFAVEGGMPGRQARELCRDLVFVGGHLICPWR